MKLTKIVFVIMLTLTLNAYSQDREQRFSIYSYSDFSSMKDDGFNIGFGLDYQMTLMYFDVQVFVYPDLRGKDYLEFTGTILGFNKHFGGLENDQWRIYLGTKLGLIFRDGSPFPTFGIEYGLDWDIPTTDLYIGVGGDLILRKDGKVWEAYSEDYWRGSVFGKLGFRF